MTNIRTTCSSCGDIELTHDELRLELTPEWTTGTYCFECPYCSQTERRPASQRVVTILLAAGVAYEVIDDSITEEEIRTFANRLDSDDWMSHLLAP